MKKIFLTALLAFTLSGCISDPLLNNQFPSIVEKPAGDLSGVWTGAMGPYLTTIKLGSNGLGYSCYAWNGKQVVGRVKFDGVNIQFQEGTYLSVISNDQSTLNVNVPYAFGKNYIFMKDNNLSSADPFCAKELPSLN